jgi:hypothetical protein
VFINYLREHIPKHQVQLNTEVVSVSFDEQSHRNIVILRDVTNGNESIVSCDHLIWTTSLGHLKNNFRQIFASERLLLQQKQQAIENLGFGALNKVGRNVF